MNTGLVICPMTDECKDIDSCTMCPYYEECKKDVYDDNLSMPKTREKEKEV
jgi:hypothetical protein